MTVEEKTTDVVTPEADTSQEQAQQQPSTTDETTKRLEYLEKEFKEVVKQRDELKKKTREIEEMKEKEKLETLQKAGNIEELNKELLRKLGEIEAERADLLQYKEKFTIFEQQVKQDLLLKLPESKRKFVQGLTIEELKEFVALEEAQTTKVGTADAGRPGKGFTNAGAITVDEFREMTPEQKNALAEKYPKIYGTLILQSRRRN